MALDWNEDEVILAADLARENGWKGLRPTDLRVQELSRLLRHAPFHPIGERDEKFRNPNGVSRKTVDVATQHPDYQGRPTRGGHTDRRVLEAFLSEPERMRAVAAAVRQSIAVGGFTQLDPTDLDFADSEAVEGRLLLVSHRRRERDPRLRARKLRRNAADGHDLNCEVCGFNFSVTYGETGNGYIEVHHIRPLHDSGPTTTRLDDLALLCANCHRVIHRARPWITPSALKFIVEQEGSRPAIQGGPRRGNDSAR